MYLNREFPVFYFFLERDKNILADTRSKIGGL